MHRDFDESVDEFRRACNHRELQQPAPPRHRGRACRRIHDLQQREMDDVHRKRPSPRDDQRLAPQNRRCDRPAYCAGSDQQRRQDGRHQIAAAVHPYGLAIDNCDAGCQGEQRNQRKYVGHANGHAAYTGASSHTLGQSVHPRPGRNPLSGFVVRGVVGGRTKPWLGTF